MKSTTVAMLAAMILPAAAPSEDPEVRIQRLALCNAIDLSLMQLHTELAASITAMSKDPPQELKLIRESYRALADADHNRMIDNKKLIDGLLEADAQRSMTKLYVDHMAEVVTQIKHALGTTDYDTLVEVEQRMLTKSHECETYMANANKPEADQGPPL